MRPIGSCFAALLASACASAPAPLHVDGLRHDQAHGTAIAYADPTRPNAARTTPAEAPYRDGPPALWLRLEGAEGRRFLTAVFRPPGPRPLPVVVLLHGSGGLSPSILSVADEVSRAGFLVVAGCWQAAEAPTEGNRICAEATPMERWVADPAAHCGKELIALAGTLPGARADRVGLLGISRGGHAALWAASTGARVEAVAVDAPAHVPAIDRVPPKPLVVLGGLTAPVLLLHGTADDVISVEQTREYEQAARALGKPVAAAYFEGAGHVTTIDPRSRAEARRRAIDFLREHLAR
jgi:dienelactone hydrolase